MKAPPREPRGEGFAHGGVFRAAHVQHQARRAHALRKAAPRAGTEVLAPALVGELVDFRPGEHQRLAVQQAHLEHRAEAQILLRDKGAEIPARLQRAADERQAFHRRDLLAFGLGRRGLLGFRLAHSARHGLADQVQLALRPPRRADPSPCRCGSLAPDPSTRRRRGRGASPPRAGRWPPRRRPRRTAATGFPRRSAAWTLSMGFRRKPV